MAGDWLRVVVGRLNRDVLWSVRGGHEVNATSIVPSACRGLLSHIPGPAFPAEADPAIDLRASPTGGHQLIYC